MTSLSRLARHAIPAACAATLAIAVLSAPPAGAAPAPANVYGAHVVHCVQGHGFDGVQNPSMHRGRSGWDSSHVC
jgi:hypothetical protein